MSTITSITDSTTPHSDGLVCEICGSSSISTIFANEMMMGKGEKFRYAYCNSCESTYQPIKLENYGKYYPSTYYSFKFREPKTLGEHIRKWKRNARNKYYYLSQGVVGKLLTLVRPRPINHLSQHVKIHREMSILEIGCGAGELLFELGELGLSNVVGIDPFVPEDICFRNGVRIYKATLENFKIKQPSEKYDLVMFNHSLEHSPTPFQDLAIASSFLKSNGELLIRWPVSGSMNAKLYGQYWWSLDSPRHIYLFSIKSMQLLAASVGMKVIRTHFEGTIDDYLASEQHKLGIPLMASNSYITTGSFNLFKSEDIQRYQEQINIQNRNGTASQAGFILSFKQ